MLAPALWNGFPLLQYDTGGYLARWYEGTLEQSRSTVYGLFLNLLTWPDFWPAIVVQAALTVWVLALVLRVHGLGEKTRVLVVTVAALSASPRCRGLPACCSPTSSPGLAVLALHLMVLRADALARWERAGAVRVHRVRGSDPQRDAGGAARAAGGGIAGRPSRPPAWCRSRGSPAALAALALGAAMLVAANYAVAGRLAWTPGGIALTFGRMLDDGIVARYLDDHCPDPRFRLCEHRPELPDDADVFFWGESVFDRLGRFEGMNDEMRTIVLESLREYPALQLQTALKAWATQLVRVRTGYGVNTEIWHTYGMIENFVPAALPRHEGRAPAAGRARRGVRRRSIACMCRSPGPRWSLLLGVIALGFARARFADLGWLAATVALAILANAMVFGVLSGPHNRYGARLAWMAPFVLLMVPWRARRRAEPKIDGGG